MLSTEGKVPAGTEDGPSKVDPRLSCPPREALAARPNCTWRECDLVAAILDTTAALVVVLDAEERVVRFNRLCEEVSGYTVEEVLGRRLSELSVLPAEQVDVWRHMLQSSSLRPAGPREVYWQTRRGDRRLVAWSTTALCNAAGDVDFVLATGTDITDRRCAEHALKWEEARLNSLLELSQKASELSERELVQLTLDEAVRWTTSELGCLHVVAGDQQSLQFYAWSSASAQRCEVSHQTREEISRAGVWADSVRMRQPVVRNDYVRDAVLHPLPLGKLRLKRHLSVPIMDGDRVTLVLGLGNKPCEYTDSDVRQTRLIGDNLWKSIRRKRAEQLLRESESRYRTLVEMSPDAIFFTDLEGRFLAANRQFLQLYGYRDVEEIQQIGLRVVDLVAPQDRRRSREDARRTRDSGMVRNSQYETIRRDGSLFPAEVSLSLVVGADSEPLGLMGVIRDITERRALENALKKHVRALEEEDRRRNDFLAMLAHELRNPLAPICSSVEVLRRPGADPTLAGRARDVIGRQVEHLIRLIDDLLDVSRITRGKIEIQPERIAVEEVVRSGMEISRALIEECGHQLSTALPDEPLYVQGDPVRLAQVIANLLNNAAKYTPNRGQIAISVRCDDRDVAIRVSDNGVGIPPDVLPRVFDLFVQADRSLERSRGGLGLGLTLVRQLVELHGGSVAAHSAGIGLGSEFTVRLPLAAEPRNLTRPAAAVDRGNIVQKRFRVLVVDDHADSAAMLAELLNLCGQEARTALDGPSALAVADTFHPDLVLLDIGLPDMDGYEVARRLRARPSGKDCLLVALSGFGHQEALQRSRQAGFQHHLVKPVDVQKLLDILHLR